MNGAALEYADESLQKDKEFLLALAPLAEAAGDLATKTALSEHAARLKDPVTSEEAKRELKAAAEKLQQEIMDMDKPVEDKDMDEMAAEAEEKAKKEKKEKERQERKEGI